MLENFIYAKQKSLFEEALNNGEVLDEAIVFIEDTKEIWNHGTYFDGKSVDLSDIESSVQNVLSTYGKSIENLQELTYSELKTLISTNALVPGKKYAITDYTCIYIQPVSLEEMEITADDVKYIVCTALSTSELSENVDYIRNEGYAKIIECKYDVNPENCAWTKGMTTLQPKGVIYYMKDEYNNECPYDFKHIKFRRWAVTDITPCTTPDDGATYPCSPYKVYATSNAKKWSDDRKRIGSGDIRDKNIIEGAFSGKWANATEECKTFFGSTDENPVEFTDECVIQNVKPYQSTTYTRDKYLAWQPNMNDTGAFAPSTFKYQVNHQAIISTTNTDFIDVYTFDKDGQDLSELKTSSGIPVVSLASVGVYYKAYKLPNTCFIVSQKLNNQTAIFIRNLTIKIAIDNTILMYSYLGASSSQSSNVNIDYFNANLFIARRLFQVKVSGTFNKNILVGSWEDVEILHDSNNNVWFGAYKNVETRMTSGNLWVGAYYFQLTNTSGEYTTKDGTYTYEFESEGNLYSNILMPMQYCKFSAHFNTNSFRAPYVKGVMFEGANQLCSYGECKWGVRVCYGNGQGIKYGALKTGTTIGSYAFLSRFRYSTDGVELFDDDQPQIPDLYNTDVRGYYGRSEKLENLSESKKQLLLSSKPSELVWIGENADVTGHWEANYKYAEGGDNFEELTYQELYNKVQNAQLMPGKKYAINDYSCIYIQPISLEEMEIECPDVKYIICEAISEHELSDNVEYVRHDGYIKIDACKYSIDPETCLWTKGMTTKSPKGVVYYMKDMHNNSCCYDFKHVKFRRWAINDITPFTTPDDGATYPCSPFKVYMTDSAQKWSDDRIRIGSGGYDDATLIEGAYSGKWANATQECKDFFGSTEENIIEFTDEHVLHNVKPYQNPDFPRNKYLAWQTDMHASGAFENTTSKYQIHHQSNIITNPDDYIDVYTFDYNGVEGSDLVVAETNSIKIASVNIGRYDVIINETLALPNTVFMFTDNLISKLTSDGLLIRTVNIQNAQNNTILMHPTLAYKWSQWVEMDIKDLTSNLLITQSVNRSVWNGKFTRNIVVGSLINFNTRNQFYDNVLFGKYTTVEIGGLAHANLWYGTYEVKTNAVSGAYTTKDGTATYEVETEGNLYANILCPMQYCHISAHFNTNTMRSPYTKGFIVEGANQGSSYGECKWGVRMCYGSGGYQRYGGLYYTTINTYTFGTEGGLTTNGIYKVNTWQHPDLRNTHVYAYYGLGSKLQNLTEAEKELLASERATELTWNGGSFDYGGKWEVRLKVASTEEAPQDENYYVRKDKQWTIMPNVSTQSNGLMTSADKQKLDSIPESITVSTAGTYGPTAAVTGSNNATIAVPQITVDEHGRVTSVTSYNFKAQNTTYNKMSASEASAGTSTTGRLITPAQLHTTAVINTGSSNLKMQVVTALPSSPDANTLYIITG